MFQNVLNLAESANFALSCAVPKKKGNKPRLKMCEKLYSRRFICCTIHMPYTRFVAFIQKLSLCEKGCTNREIYPIWIECLSPERICLICRIPLHSVMVIVKLSLWNQRVALVLVFGSVHLCNTAPSFLGSKVLFLLR